MVQYDARRNSNVPRILELFGNLKMKVNYDKESMEEFMQFINLLADQPYMRKTEEFLLFLEHCMPIDKCMNIQILREYKGLSTTCCR